MEIKHGGYAAVAVAKERRNEGKKPKSKKKIIVFDQLTVKSYQSGTNNSLNNTYFEKKQVTCMTPTKAPAAFMLYNIPTLESMRNFLPKAIGLGMPAWASLPYKIHVPNKVFVLMLCLCIILTPC